MLSHNARGRERSLCAHWRGRGFSLRLLLWLGLWAALGVWPAAARALTPDSPQVKAKVAKAIKFLEAAKPGSLGEKALVGLTLAKHGAPETAPQIQDGIKTIQEALKAGPDRFGADIYSTGIAIMFLVAVHPSKYRVEIEDLVESLHYRQKQHGAWGYPLSADRFGGTCDTSMTQYAVLGMWEAEDQAGVPTSAAVWDRVAEWLILTQDPGGGWGYQGDPAERLGAHTMQGGVKHSLTAAAMGSLYIVKDRLGIRKLKKTPDDETPSVLEPIQIKEAVKTKLDLRHFSRALSAGNRWMESNYQIGKIDKEKDFWHYSVYALERFDSLKQADEAGYDNRFADEDASERAEGWYTQGARVLLSTQSVTGSWKSMAGEIPDTCFATLFLIGSTKKSLQKSSLAKFKTGVMRGGTGLPAVDGVRVRDGRVVVKPLDAPPDEILRTVANPDDPKFAESLEALAELAAEGDLAILKEQGRRLARLAATAGTAVQVRILAVQAISRSRNLDLAPLLIRLLDDPNPEVMTAASTGLGEISRKFTDFGLGTRPTELDRNAAVGKWKDWFATVRPDLDIESFDPLDSDE